MADLERGGILHRRDHISAEEIFDFYKRLPQFENVVWSQFEVRLKAHRTVCGVHDLCVIYVSLGPWSTRTKPACFLKKIPVPSK
jgi:hypothetical protein